MDHLDKLESRSIYILRETYARYRNSALLWAVGKDSTVMLWIARKAFFGKIPFPVLHIDTSMNFKEMYEFREYYKEKWKLDLIVTRNEEAIEKGIGPGNTDMDECCHALKTVALKNCREKYGFKALFFALRGDDQNMAIVTRCADNGDQPSTPWDVYTSTIDANGHLRVHPMQHWALPEIWKYIKREQIPVPDIYFAKNGKRYRGINCVPCCALVESSGNTIEKIIKESEKVRKSEQRGAGATQEDEYTIQKLKSLGYM